MSATDPSVTEGVPTLRDLFAVSARATSDGEYGDLPARVLAYSHATKLVDVQPIVLVPRRGALRLVGPVQALLVRWPAGSTWALTGPLVAGDFGWIRPAGADTSAWKMRGIENDPQAKPRRGALVDAVFEPGSRPVSAPLPAEAYHATAAVLYAAVELLLGDSTATDKVALDSLVRAAIQVVYDAHDLHIHVAPGGNTGVPTVLFTPAVPANVGASKVKAK